MQKSVRTLRIQQVAEKTGLSKSQIWLLTKKGILKKYKLSQSVTVWREDEINQYLISLVGA